VLIGEATSSAALAVNSTHLVSLAGRGSPSNLVRDVTRFDKAASAPGGELLATLGPVFADVIALDEQAAFVTRGAEGDSFVTRVTLDGGEVSSIVQGPPESTLLDVDVAGDHVLFASTGGVGRASISGGAAALISLQFAYRVRADAERAYYFARGDRCEDGSDIYRVPLGGGVPFRIGREPGCIRELVQDADALYWLTSDGGSIRTLGKD
jgi:hypothetical protein